MNDPQRNSRDRQLPHCERFRAALIFAVAGDIRLVDLRNIRPLKQQPHCGLMPAICTTLSHFAASAAMQALNAAALSTIGTVPTSAAVP